MFRRKNGRIGSSASPLLGNEFKDQSGLTEEPVKKRKGGRKKAGEGGDIMLLLYSTLGKSRETSRTGLIILSLEVWVALESQDGLPQKLRFSLLAQDSFGTYASQLPTWRSICHSLCLYVC